MKGIWFTDVAAMTFRVIAIAIGGYVLASGFSALSGMALHATGVPLNDAMLAAVLLGYIFYIAVVMWGFAHPQGLLRPLSILGAAALTMAAAAHFAPEALGL